MAGATPAFTCPLTKDVMVDPVLAADGHNYERAALEQWLARNAFSPVTNAPMGPGDFRANERLREQLVAMKQQRCDIPAEHLQLAYRIGGGQMGEVSKTRKKRKKRKKKKKEKVVEH